MYVCSVCIWQHWKQCVVLSILPIALAAGLSIALPRVLQSKMFSYYWQRDLVSL